VPLHGLRSSPWCLDWIDRESGHGSERRLRIASSASRTAEVRVAVRAQLTGQHDRRLGGLNGFGATATIGLPGREDGLLTRSVRRRQDSEHAQPVDDYSLPTVANRDAFQD